MDSKSAFAKVSGQGLKVLLKVAKKIERFTTFKREDKITHRRVPHTPPLQRIHLHIYRKAQRRVPHTKNRSTYLQKSTEACTRY